VLYKNLVEIVDLVCGKATKTCDLMQWIVQKYIENPLLVLNRKFDIRLWVLITNWNPLEIWTYAEPYIRFPASDFSFDNISNRYAHLSNNSVCKNATKVSTTHEIEGNMWRLDQLTDHLEEEFGYNVWEDVIIDKVKNVVINTMESV
jgi:tubulin monoglycylase TTLL3/8